MAEEINVTQFLGLTGVDQLKDALGGSANVKKSIDEARTAIKPLLADISKEFEKIGKKLKADIAAAMGGTGGDTGGTSAGTNVITGIETAKAATAAAKAAGSGGGGGGISNAISGLSSGGGTKMLGGLMKGGGMAAAGTAILGGINMGIDAANSRFERGREGVLAADRMSVLYQQMTGQSQLGVSSTYRMPLTQYRLGAGGINDLMAMEAQTGISGRQQASSVEAMRTLSGYQLSTGDVTGMMASLASAPTANRLFMMTGTGLIGPGGTQNSMMSVMQNIVRSAGLTDKDTLKSALQPGSVTRAKLTAMGVPSDMITQVIQYAQSNLTYKEKGGKGMYDPSQEGARRLMGIEENFATQVEETQRLETSRDEQFYRRQVDNYAHLERQTQTLTRAFGALEDKLSGILGMVGSNRIATTIFQGVTGGGGDPDGNTAGVSASTPNVKSALNNSSFKQLHPKMRDRVMRMMADNPNVGFGEGVRSAASQRTMFTSRYKKTDKQTTNGKPNVYWDGSYWEHVSGNPAAPPGRSMHEIGLAVDLTGDFDWVVKNAHKYGLKHFGGVNNEPWHVQPEELPNSRSKYEESGAPWGRGGVGAAPYTADSDFGDSLDHYGGGESQAQPQRGYGNVTIADRVERSISVGSGSGVGGVRGGNSKKAYGKVKSSAGTYVTFGDFRGGGTAKSGVDITRWAQDFLREVGAPINLANMEAISAWIAAEGTKARFNPLAVVSKPTAEAMGGTTNLDGWTDFNTTGVKDFANYQQGLKMNAYHIMKHGKGVIKALQSNTNNPYDIITAIEKMVKGWAPDYAARGVLEGRGVPTSLSGGDPAGPPQLAQMSGGGGTAAVSLTGGPTFNISPNIVMSGNGSSQDLQKIAKEVAALIRKEIELQALRRS
jgi:hypothetical protein